MYSTIEILYGWTFSFMNKKESDHKIENPSNGTPSRSGWENIALLGNKIHNRRKELGLSLRGLARQTGLTASFLSQFECGHSSASIGSIQKICEVLNLSLFTLLSEQNDAAPTQEGKSAIRSYSPVVRASQRAKINFPNIPVVFELLTSSPSWKIEAFYNHLEGGKNNVVRRLRTPTEELLFMLSGELVVELDDGIYTLHEQDALYFEGSRLIKLANPSKQEAAWLSIITPAVF